MTKIFTLGKNERLKSLSDFEELFEKSLSFSSDEFKLIYCQTEYHPVFPVKAAFIVSKRNFKKAHDRNRIKRLMKEAYRVNKSIIYSFAKTKQTGYNIAFIYQSKRPCTAHRANEKIIVLLQRFIQQTSISQ